jgi:hypothetical protein
MAAIVGDRVLDIGLAALDAECDKIFVCLVTGGSFSKPTMRSRYWGIAHLSKHPQ